MFLLGLLLGVLLMLVFFWGGASMTRTVEKTAPVAPQAQVAKPSINDRILTIVKKIGIDEAAFNTCFTANKYTAKITAQQTEGGKAGVRGTPGNILYDTKTKKAWLISGAQPLDVFKGAIDAFMKNPSAPAPASATLISNVPPIVDGDHVRGEGSERFMLIEYSDFECPFCHRVHPTYTQLFKDYSGKMAWVYRHYPLDFHPDAMPLAQASECVAELGGNDAFWSFTDAAMNQG